MSLNIDNGIITILADGIRKDIDSKDVISTAKRLCKSLPINKTNRGGQKMTAKSQKQSIREYLEKGNSITGKEADKMFGCGRLPARVLEINEDLYREQSIYWIICEMIPIIGFNGKHKRIGRYRMIVKW